MTATRAAASMSRRLRSRDAQKAEAIHATSLKTSPLEGARAEGWPAGASAEPPAAVGPDRASAEAPAAVGPDRASAEPPAAVWPDRASAEPAAESEEDCLGVGVIVSIRSGSAFPGRSGRER